LLSTAIASATPSALLIGASGLKFHRDNLLLSLLICTDYQVFGPVAFYVFKGEAVIS